MKCKKINDYEYLIESNSYIDIFNSEEVISLIKDTYNKYLNNFTGDLEYEIYNDTFDNLKIHIKKCNNYKKYINIKLSFHINTLYLYKINNYCFIKLLPKRKIKTYYYQNEYYIEQLKVFNTREKSILSEISEVIYGSNVYRIIEKSVKNV